ncbi:MAG TPA: inorganic pyrophosphatase [candidate division Zixibacteria bacterium]|nr:inorganic pyrophosphatase [candidate division Zixibacteria bacterium]
MRYNASFWESLESLLRSGEVVIDRPKGSRHPRYTDAVYPLDYGYVKGTLSLDNSGIDVWRGSGGTDRVTGALCTVDLDKRDSEVKILFDCTDEEKRTVLDFQNHQQMHAILIDRM